ncbi:uncharacterized protein LOC120781634 [Bactrocera tryoni]|uniref:uncharacterized protein LOC120781634 n=1 Tax=Bactrocera tryoni TaxID=59916 RepID=UPI001A97B555|nr:uncharacterized protein LOC120781634 [Bactrocera tryoni]
MSENPNIGKGFQKENKENVNSYWKKLYDFLNSMGPPLKSNAEWKKIDQKGCMRKNKKTPAKDCVKSMHSLFWHSQFWIYQRQ